MQRKQPENAQQSKPVLDYERGMLEVYEKWAVKALREYRKAPSREGFHRLKVDRIMRVFWSHGLRPPIIFLDFARALWPNRNGVDRKQKAKLEQHAHFIALRARGQRCSDRQLSERIGVSRKTISEWRTPESTNAFLEEMNDPSSPVSLMVKELSKGIELVERTPESHALDSETHELIRIELRPEDSLWLQREAVKAGNTVSEHFAQIIHSAAAKDPQRRPPRPEKLAAAVICGTLDRFPVED